MPVTIVADDLTGACDAGALFAGRAPVPILIGTLAAAADWPAVAVDTESRGLEAAEAAALMRRTAAGLAVRLASGIVFKKIDSTFRGPIVAELAALLETIRASTVLVCPAFPAEGRTVLNGMLLVDGVPAHETPVGLDPAYPGPLSDLLDILSREGTSGIPVTHLPLKEVRVGAEELRRGLQGRRGILVADAETDADLEALARAGLAQGSLLLAGSAGLARPVSAALGLTSRPVSCPAPGAWLIVAGSRHPSTRAQIAALEAGGVAGARVSQAGEAALDSVISALKGGQPAFMASPDGSARADKKMAATLAALSLRAVIASPSIVAITGGETAHAFVHAWGATRLELDGAPAPGLALGRLVAPDGSTLPILTKAGGFGSPELLLTLARGAA
jgi:4-hydroxythreonine-4-phosphate dehydrogenase